jgi:hypothetical protein
MSAISPDKEVEPAGEPARSEEPALSGDPVRSGEPVISDGPPRPGEPEVTTGPIPSDDFDPTVIPPSAEVAIHELGESLAATVASVQGEMARYNTALGTYVLDEIDISIPVMLRVTKLGQVLARVTDTQAPDSAVGQIRLRLKPSTGAAPVPTPSGASQPLSTIELISREALARLEGDRVFSVGDLLRLAATPAGRDALAREVFGFMLQPVLDRAALMSLPLPSGVSTLLVKLGLNSPEQFVKSDPAQLADSIRSFARLPVQTADVSQWQEASAAYMDALPLYG